MKKIFLAAIVMFGATFGFAQENIVDKHFSHYKGTDEFTTVHISGKMFELASQIDIEVEGEEMKTLKEMASRIESFNLIVGEELPNLDSEYKSAVKLVRSSHEELMRVNSPEGNFMFKVDEDNGIVRELILVGKAEGKFIVFSLMGEIELNELGTMMKGIQDHGISDLSGAFEGGANKFKVYPNPVGTSDQLTISVPENMQGGDATINDMNGNVMQSILGLNSSKEQISTQGLVPGTYIITLTKGETIISKQVVVQ